MVAEPQSASHLAERLNKALQDAPENTVDATVRLLEAARGHRARLAYTARALTALATLVERADEETLVDALGAPSDYAVLIQALNQPQVLERLRERDPLMPAKIRGLRARERLLAAEGGTFTVSEVAGLLGLTRQAVDKRRKAGKIVGLMLGKRWHVYPAWQFGPAGVLPGLEAVLADLGRHDPWMKVAFMLGSNTNLGGETPLAALRRGEVDRVQTAARLYGEQVAT
jgi:hypothetical protein